MTKEQIIEASRRPSSSEQFPDFHARRKVTLAVTGMYTRAPICFE